VAAVKHPPADVVAPRPRSKGRGRPGRLLGRGRGRHG
jgi:hypothetical protein